jgi:hypothetical protein
MHGFILEFYNTKLYFFIVYLQYEIKCIVSNAIFIQSHLKKQCVPSFIKMKYFPSYLYKFFAIYHQINQRITSFNENKTHIDSSRVA